jgi:formylglycine-generating enzyme required for sulfatase activity
VRFCDVRTAAGPAPIGNWSITVTYLLPTLRPLVNGRFGPALTFQRLTRVADSTVVAGSSLRYARPLSRSGTIGAATMKDSELLAPLFAGFVMVLACGGKTTNDGVETIGGDDDGSGGAGGLEGESAGATGGGDAGEDGPPSCRGLPRTCGPNADDDCCASERVPGGEFLRGYDDVTFTDPGYPATLDDFYLDTYEVTVGRFRKFVSGYPDTLPAAGAGANPNNAGDPGWMRMWEANMPGTRAELLASLPVCSPVVIPTWTEAPAGANEALPMTCLEWFEAFAFCIWDGGRIPNEAEWNYAAAGGSEQRVYPWSVPPTSTNITDTHAIYDHNFCDPDGDCRVSILPSVGALPAGNARWGQADMAGSVAEWVLDFYTEPYQNPCTNCAVTTTGSERVLRGGSRIQPDRTLLASARSSYPPDLRDFVGARCARDL